MTTAAEVLERARPWIGRAETPDGSNTVPGITDWYGIRGPWCAMFVSRVFYDAGLPQSFDTAKGFAWTPSGVNGYKARGQWHAGRIGIAPGDVVFYSWNDHRYPVDHVELVESVQADGRFVTIGGNVGNRVGRFLRTSCVGYGRPAYTAAPPPPPPGRPPTGLRVPRPSVPPFLRCVQLDSRFRPVGKFRAVDGTGGTQVGNLQRALNVLAPSDALAIDGAFGWATHVKVWTWQEFAGLKPDGVVGPKTAASIDGWLTLTGR